MVLEAWVVIVSVEFQSASQACIGMFTEYLHSKELSFIEKILQP